MSECGEVRVDITEYFDDFTSEGTVWLSEEQRQDIKLIGLFYAEQYRKSLIHKVIRFLCRFYMRKW